MLCATSTPLLLFRQPSYSLSICKPLLPFPRLPLPVSNLIPSNSSSKRTNPFDIENEVQINILFLPMSLVLLIINREQQTNASSLILFHTPLSPPTQPTPFSLFSFSPQHCATVNHKAFVIVIIISTVKEKRK